MNNRNLFPIVLETGKSKIKVLANSESGKSPLLVHRWQILTGSVYGGRGDGVLFIRASLSRSNDLPPNPTTKYHYLGDDDFNR